MTWYNELPTKRRIKKLRDILCEKIKDFFLDFSNILYNDIILIFNHIYIFTFLSYHIYIFCNRGWYHLYFIFSFETIFIRVYNQSF